MKFATQSNLNIKTNYKDKQSYQHITGTYLLPIFHFTKVTIPPPPPSILVYTPSQAQILICYMIPSSEVKDFSVK